MFTPPQLLRELLSDRASYHIHRKNTNVNSTCHGKVNFKILSGILYSFVLYEAAEQMKSTDQ